MRRYGARVRRLLFSIALLALVVVIALPPLSRALGSGANPRLVPPPARSVAIGNGLALNVREVGAGSLVVLVHGLPSNIGDWADVPDRLAALGHRVVVYDRIGYGHSSRPAAGADAYTLAANATQLGALLDALDVERAALVGWSYGGGVVQTFAVEQPARVSHLVLLASVGPAIAEEPVDPVGALATSAIGPAVFHWLTGVPWLSRAVVAGSVANTFSGAEHVPPGWTERTVAQLAMPGTIDAFLAEERNDGYAALRPEAITAPTLVLHGSDDRGVPPRVGEDLARRLPHGELALVEGGSHMLPGTHAELVAARIHEWMAR